MEKMPKVGMGIVVVKDNKILMMQRRNAHGDGSWSIPGGHLEYFEELENCAIREVFEETGVKVKNPTFVDVTNDFFPEEDKHYITIFMKAEYESGEPKITEPDKCVNVDWREFEKLPSPLFIPFQNLIDRGFNPFSKFKRYQHYKGNTYEIIGTGKHSDTLEEYVVYRGLYNSEEFGKNPVWVKSKEEFSKKVVVDGKKVPRFKKIKEVN